MLLGAPSELSCEVVFGDQRVSTKSIKDDNAPFWDEAVRMYVIITSSPRHHLSLFVLMFVYAV